MYRKRSENDPWILEVVKELKAPSLTGGKCSADVGRRCKQSPPRSPPRRSCRGSLPLVTTTLLPWSHQSAASRRFSRWRNKNQSLKALRVLILTRCVPSNTRAKTKWKWKDVHGSMAVQLSSTGSTDWLNVHQCPANAKIGIEKKLNWILSPCLTAVR